MLASRGLQVAVDDQLVEPVGLQRLVAAQPFQEVAGLDAGGPDREAGRDHLAAGHLQAVGGDLDHFFVGVHLDGQLAQLAQRRFAQALGQLRQQARRGFDQHDLQVLFRVDVVKAVVGQHTRRGMQLGRQFHAGGAAADDGHRQAAAAGAARHGLRAYAGVDQAVVETFGGLRAVQLDACVRPRPACRSRWSGCRRRSPACRSRSCCAGVISRPASSWLAASCRVLRGTVQALERGPGGT